ncbi:molybdenum cofactor biosynthesis protein A, partial [Yasminevirus sp. GU-2018]
LKIILIPNGKGYFIKSPSIVINKLHLPANTINPIDSLSSVDSEMDSDMIDHFSQETVETVVAKSLALNSGRFKEFREIVPRSVSILPIAKGCQAKCSFCFSHSSVSEDTKQLKLSTEYVEDVLKTAKSRGAERAVITGGGEPTLLPHSRLLDYISLCKKYYDKVVLISNGYVLSNNNVDEETRLSKMLDLQEAGLSVLSISRHGIDETTNANIMNLKTMADRIAKTYRINKSLFPDLKLRWVTVLQKGGVDSEETLVKYLDWVVATEVDQVCFKELYVAVSEESVYYDSKYNRYSRQNQIPLDMVTSYLTKNGSKIVSTLPWGSPVHEFIHKGRRLQIACYTEPSLFWERTTGVCRSWNIMADRKVYVSLEDSSSDISSFLV